MVCGILCSSSQTSVSSSWVWSYQFREEEGLVLDPTILLPLGAQYACSRMSVAEVGGRDQPVALQTDIGKLNSVRCIASICHGNGGNFGAKSRTESVGLMPQCRHLLQHVRLIVPKCFFFFVLVLRVIIFLV